MGPCLYHSVSVLITIYSSTYRCLSLFFCLLLILSFFLYFTVSAAVPIPLTLSGSNSISLSLRMSLPLYLSLSCPLFFAFYSICPFVLMFISLSLTLTLYIYLTSFQFFSSRSKYIKVLSYPRSLYHYWSVIACILLSASMPSFSPCLSGPIFLSLSLTFCSFPHLNLRLSISNFDFKSLSLIPYLFILSLSPFQPFFDSWHVSLSLCFNFCLYVCPQLYQCVPYLHVFVYVTLSVLVSVLLL